MSKPTPTLWRCLNCETEEYKPAWLARARSFCSVECRTKYTKSIDPEYFLKMGARANPHKISNTLKAKGIAPPSRIGSTRSIKSKQKQSETLKSLWATKTYAGNKGKILTISKEGYRRKVIATIAMRRRLAYNGRLTNLEKIVNDYLHLHKIEHLHEYRVGNKSMDFYLPKQGIFIEADGDYWHQDKLKDMAKDLYVKKLMPKVKIIRCSETRIKNGTWVNLMPWQGAKRGV